VTGPIAHWPIRSPTRSLLGLSLILAASLSACAAVPGQGPAAGAEEAPAVGPHINAPFQAPDFPQWLGSFERAGREVFDERFRIVAALGLQPGATVADIGAGTGMFTLLFARAVGPTGRVYAVEIAQNFLAGILERTKDYRVTNVVGVLGTQDDTGLEEASIDLAFVCDTYHHFEYPKAMLASIARALRPGGELVVIDYRRTPGLSSPWVQGHVRAGQEQATEEIVAAGFVPLGEETFLRDNWFLRFRKADVGPTEPPRAQGQGQDRPKRRP
jgi:SAM-dependent methyltransferase